MQSISNLSQIRICDGCGARLRSTYIRTHQRRYCPGPAVDESVEGINSEAEFSHDEQEEEEEEEVQPLDEIMGEVNDEDQTLLGAGLGGADPEEEEAALRLQEQLWRQRQQRERTPPSYSDSDDTEDMRRRFRVLQDLPPRRRQRMASPPPDDNRPVIPLPPSPLPLDLSGV